MLAYSCNAYTRFALEEALRRIADLGYTGVELMADAPHLWPEDVTPRQIESVRGLLDRLHLRISNINAFMMTRIGDPRQPYWYPSWIEPDRAYRQIRIDHTVRSLTLASELGAPSISTEPGGPVPAGAGRRDALTDFAEGLRPVLEHAGRAGVKLLIEPEPGLLIETSEQYLQFCASVASPMLGLNLDIGHLYCVGEDVAASIRSLGPRINHVHAEGIAATRVHRHLVPGDGAMDFASICGALAEVEYRGWISVELYPYVDDPDGAGRRARAHLLRHAPPSWTALP